MRTVLPESMDYSRQDTVTRRPVGCYLSATAFWELIRRPGWPTFHATGAQTISRSLPPSSPKAIAIWCLLERYPYRPATTERFATQRRSWRSGTLAPVL